MPENTLDLMEGVYTPTQPVAPFPDQPVLPQGGSPDLSFLGSGGRGGAGGGFDFEAEMRNMAATLPTKGDIYRAFDPVPFNRKESGFDPIYKSFGDGLYKKLGFIPGYDNEDMYANELGKSGQFWQGLKGIVPLAGMAHNEAWRSEADFWGGLFQGDLKKAFSMTMDEGDLQRIYDESREVFDSNFVPLTREQRDSSFNMGKFSRGFQQFGFTAGTMLQFAEQTLAEMAIGAVASEVTGGLSLGAGFASLGRRMAKTAKVIDKVYDMSKAYKKILQFENTVMDVTRLRKTFDYLKTGVKNSPVGSFQNFYRFSKEYNFAASEARFERAQSYGDYIENKEREIKDMFGRDLTPEEREKAQQEALEVSNANGVTNIALLYAMNRINMDNFLKMGWGMSSKIGKEAVEGIGDEIIKKSTRQGNFITNLAKKLRGKPGKEAAEQAAESTTKAAKPDMFMAKKDVKRFSNEWWNGKGNDVYRWGTDSAWEGVQEMGQSTSAEYWQNYYNDKNKMSAELKDNWSNLMSLGTKSLKKATASQFDREGFDTFLSGFIIGGPSAMINIATGKIQKAMYGDKFAARDNFVAERVKFLNDWARSPMQVLDPKLKNYADQTEIKAGLNKAVQEGNIYAFQNLSRKGFQKAVLEGYNSGKLDTMFDMMDKAAEELSDEEFKEAFGITDTTTAITAETRKSARDYVTQLKSKAGELVKTIEDVRTRAVNPHDYTKYPVGSEEYKESQLKHMGWEALLENYIFEKDANRDLVERYKGILGKNQETLGAQAYPAFYMMTNPEFVKYEINSLRTEVMSMEAMGLMLSPDQREQLKAKRVELDTLQKFDQDLKKDPKQIDMADMFTQRRLEYFSKYINIIQKKNKADLITQEALEEAFADLADLYRLDADKRQVFANLNYLADSENFEGLFSMHYNFLQDVYKDRMKTLDERIANREKTLELLEDDDFKRKHAELHAQFVEAKFEGNNELAGLFLDMIYEQEFPAVTEEEPVAENPDPQAPLPPAAPGAGTPPSPGVPGVTVDSMLAQIAAETDEDKLLTMFESVTDPNNTTFSKEDQQIIVSALYDRIESIKATKETGKTYVSPTSAEFVIPYNVALVEIQKRISNNNITEQQVNEAFALLSPSLLKLSPADRLPFVDKHKAEKEALIQKIRNNNAASDETKIKNSISQFFKPGADLKQIVDDTFDIINNVADADLKIKLIEHFEQEYFKLIDQKIAELNKHTNTSGMSAIRKGLMDNATYFRKKIKDSISKHQANTEKLAEATKDLKLTVDYEVTWQNSVDRSIQSYPDRAISKPQLAALASFYAAKLITEEELKIAEWSESRHTASEWINIAIARGYALRLNKLVRDFLKTGKADELQDELIKYRKENAEKNVEADVKADLKSMEVFTEDDLELVFGGLRIPMIENVLTDAQDKLLREYLITANLLQSDTVMDSLLKQMDDVKSEIVFHQGNVAVEGRLNIDALFSEDIVSNMSKLLKYEEGTGYSIAEFKEAINNAATSLATSTDVKEAKAILDKLVDQFANTKKKFEARNIFSAMLSTILEAESEISNPENTTGPLMQEAEMVGVLNNPTTSLSPQDIKEVEEFAKGKLLNEIKTTLNAAVGNKKDDISYDPDLANIEQDGAETFFSALRPKSTDDLRTTADLTKALEAENGQTTAKKALQFIIDSEHATDAEKELAQQLLAAVGETDLVLIDNSAELAGGFNTETKDVFINLKAAGFRPDMYSVPAETVILHELLHRFTDSALADPTSEYYKAIKSLYAAAAKDPAAGTFYAYQKDLKEDEVLYEFVAEALTNPAFQYMLAKIPYGNSKKSVWDKFVEILNNLLKTIGVDLEENVLNEVVNLTSELITPNSTGQTLNDDVILSSEKYLEKIKNAKTKRELQLIRTEIRKKRKNGEFTPSTYDALRATISRKLKSLVKSDAVRYYATSPSISIGKKTYRYRITEMGVQVFRNSTKGPVKETSVAIRQAVIEKLAEKMGGFRKLLSPADVQYIRDQGGDAMDPSSYAAGGLMNEDPVGMLRFPEVWENRPSLLFKSESDYKRFLVKYKALQKNVGKKSFARELEDLKSEFGKTSVMSFSELFYKYGSVATINKLIEAKALYAVGKGNAIEETDKSVFDFFDAVIDGDNLSLTEEQYVREDINKGLSKFFGFKVDRVLQDKVESELFDPTLQDEDDGPNPPPPPPTPDLTVDPVIAYSTRDTITVDDSSAFDYANVPFEDRKSAQEKYALRGVPNDLDKNNQPRQDFVQYYSKVREVINALSVKTADQINDFHVMLIKDDAKFRWDGSAQSEGWMKANKGVVGVITDDAGNPLVFNKQGDIVGKLDKNNLSDDKGLNNGENQIVYFNTAANNPYNASQFEKESFDKLVSAREKAMNGTPQISRLVKFTQGHMTGKVLVQPSDKTKNRADTRNEDFYDQLMQPHVSFRLSPEGKSLLAVVEDSTGAQNSFGLFPVNTGNVMLRIKKENDQEEDVKMFDHLLDLMKTFNEMMLADNTDPRLGDIGQNLMYFVRHFWFTTDTLLKIPGNLKNIGIKTGKDSYVTYREMWVQSNGQLVPGKPEDIAAVRNYINRRPVNIELSWLKGDRKFLFPYTAMENGQKIVKFVEKDYKDFMFREIGMKADVLEIKSQEDIKRYNSTVHFSDPQDLEKETLPPPPSVDDVIANDNAIGSSINDRIDNADKTENVKTLPKKNPFRRAPMLDRIYKKTCK